MLLRILTIAFLSLFEVAVVVSMTVHSYSDMVFLLSILTVFLINVQVEFLHKLTIVSRNSCNPEGLVREEQSSGGIVAIEEIKYRAGAQC